MADSNPTGRTVTGRGDLVAAHRKALGWSQEDLAAEAGVDTGTIKRLETNESVYIRTLKKVADALSLDTKSLLRAPPSQNPLHRRVPPQLVCATIVIESKRRAGRPEGEEAEILSQVQHVIKALRALLPAVGPDIDVVIEPFDIAQGSILVRTVIDSDSLYRLCRLHNEGKLEALGVTAIEISSSLRKVFAKRVSEIVEERRKRGIPTPDRRGFDTELTLIRQPLENIAIDFGSSNICSLIVPLDENDIQPHELDEGPDPITWPGLAGPEM